MTNLAQIVSDAEQGSAHDKAQVGLMYIEGQGVSQDYEKAFKWFTLAAEQGSPVAQYELGEMFYRGEGVPQDWAEAFKWHTLSAHQGFPQSQLALGVMNLKGEGVLQDETLGLSWTSLAFWMAGEMYRLTGEEVYKDVEKHAEKMEDLIQSNVTDTQIKMAGELTKEHFLKIQKARKG
jgi:TPR repeat protein